uniref:Uncharacterized protein n=2 Tax=Anabas testudineus TaxID=64144 RepID=A0AAQ6IV00_ANATE
MSVRYAILGCSPVRSVKKDTHTHVVFAVCWLLKEPVCPCRACVIMAVWDRSPLLVVIPLWMCFGRAAALSEPQICYVLDGILFLYGIILTALYCRIKIYNAREAAVGKGKPKQNVEEGIYTGLTPHAQDTYETIGGKK